MEKELRKLGRRELVDVIYQMKKNEERLQEEIAELKEALKEKRILISEAGSIAEAAVNITEIFSSAQTTADLYLNEIACPITWQLVSWVMCSPISVCMPSVWQVVCWVRRSTTSV